MDPGRCFWVTLQELFLYIYFFISLSKWLTSKEPVFMQVHYNLYIQYDVLYSDQIDYININSTFSGEFYVPFRGHEFRDTCVEPVAGLSFFSTK